MKRVAFHTLGCKLNFSETSTLAREFEQGGYTRAAKGQQADIVVVNTCSVTAEADKKCRNIVRKLSATHPKAMIVVTGCYAQLKPDEVAAIPGVDLVVGNNYKGTLFQQASTLSGKVATAAIDSCSSAELKNFFAAFSSGDRTRAFLKVQDGCSYVCSYCAIPYARGHSRNIPIASLIDQAHQIARKGQREIVLTGVNIGDFGRSTGETFLDLIKALDHVEGIDRYRISSIEPNLLTDEIIAFCAASARIMPHFHIPLQAGTNKILSLMKRRYTVERFAERIAAVRRVMPDAFIGVDVIVGFPGETEDDFDETVRFLEEVKPSFLHIFPYSERDNTVAVGLEGKVSQAEKHRRVVVLKEVSDRLHSDFCESHKGRKAKVLVEGMQKGGVMYGFTECYIKVELPFDKTLINNIVEVVL